MNKKQVIKYIILTTLFYLLAWILVIILAYVECNHYMLGPTGVMLGWFAHIASTFVEPRKGK